MLNVYTSNSYKNASRYVFELLKKVDCRALNVRHVVLVPDRATMSAEQQLLDALGGSFNAEVLTVRRYASRLLPHYEYLSKQSALMALTGVVARNKENFSCFKKGVDNLGFVSSVYELICKLKYARITPQMLSVEQLPPALYGKLKDVKLLYEQYELYLNKGFIDSATKLEKLIDALADEPSVAHTYYYFYDFESMTKQELAIVAALAARSPCVTVACTRSNDVAHKYLYLNDIFDSLRSLADDKGFELNVIEGKEQYDNALTEQIGRNLFTYNSYAKVKLDKGALTLYNLDDKEQEVAALAAYISSNVREGAKYGDFYCVTSDLNSYKSAIATIFPRYGIPYFTDDKESLADHPAAQYLIDYLSMRRNNNKKENAYNVIKNVMFEGGEAVYAFEHYCDKYNVSYDYSRFELGKKDGKIDFAQADTVRGRLQELILKYKVAPLDVGANYVAVAREFIAKENLVQKCATFADRCVAVGLPRYARVTEQVIDKLQATLNEYQAVLSDEVVRLEDFISIFSAGLAAKTVSVLPLEADCVVVTNMDKARNHNIKHLALVGATSGAMPIVKKSAGLLTEKNIRLLAEQYGIDADASVRTENKRERFSLYQLLLEAQTLFVSCATGGNSLAVPSDFFTSLSQMFVTDKGEIVINRQLDSRAFTPANALYRACNLCGKFKDNGTVAATDFQLLRDKYAAQLEKYKREQIITNVNNGDKLFLKQEETSISKVEKLYVCPYAHYFQYGLLLQPKEVAELDARIFGNILHAVLDIFVSRMALDADDSSTAALVVKCYNEVMKEEYYASIALDPRQTTTLKLLQKECIALALTLKNQLANSKFRPLATEWKFGDQTAVKVEIDGHTLRIKGIIDRIDAYGDKFYCIDYKSGKGEFSENILFMGRKLQLPVYLEAVRRNKGLTPVGFYYMPLKDSFEKNGEISRTFNGRTINDPQTVCDIDCTAEDGKSVALGVRLTNDSVSGRVVTPSQLDAEIDFALYLIAHAGELMREGYIVPSPLKDGQSSACKYCDYVTVCHAEDLYGDVAREGAKSVKPADVEAMMTQYKLKGELGYKEEEL